MRDDLSAPRARLLLATPPARDALDQALLRLADGDRSAFDEVYEAAWPRVAALARRLLGDGPDAEDAAQRAIIAVFERASRFDPDAGRALPWILGIAAWECRTVRTAQRRRREEPELPEVSDPAPHPEGAVIDADLAAALEGALGALPAVDREALAASLGRAERPVEGATFRKRVQRAMARLRSAWGQEHG